MNGEKLQGSMNFGNVTNVAALLIPANDRRHTLVISSPVTNRVTLGENKNVVDLQGLVLPVNTQPLTLCCCDVGDWINGDIYAITTAGTETIGWIEGCD